MYTDQFARASGLLTAGVTFNHTGRLVGTGPEALQALELASVMRLDLTRLLNTQPWIDRPSVLMSLVAADDRTASQELQRFACWCARRLLPLLPVEPIRFDEMISLYEQSAEGGASMQDLLFAQASLQSTDRVLSVVQALTQHQSPNRVVEAINIISDDLAWIPYHATAMMPRMMAGMFAPGSQSDAVKTTMRKPRGPRRRLRP